MTESLKSYPVMKDAGTDWLGRIPQHWDAQPLGRLGRFSTGKGGDRRDEDTAGIPCIRYGDLYTAHRRFVVEGRSFVARAKAGNYKPIQFGDVLFASTGEAAGDVGQSAVNLIRSEACCGRDVILFRPHRTVDARYLGYATDCLPAAGQKAAMGRGVTVAHIYADQLKRLTVTLPPIAEQGAIVRFLDRAERKFERFIRAKLETIALLEEQRLVTVHRAVTGQIDVRTGQPYPAYSKSGVPWLGRVPRHWIVERLKASMANIDEPCAEARRDDAYVTLDHVESWTGRLRRVAVDFPLDEEMKRFAREDILFGKLRPHLARVAYAPIGGLCGGEFLVLRPRRSAFAGRYMEQLLRSRPVTEAIRHFARGTTVSRAEWSTLGCLRVVRPPNSEQIAIVVYLERAAARIDECISRIRGQVELAREFRSRLIADVVTGKHDVRGAPVTVAELVPFAVGGDLGDAVDVAPPAPLPQRGVPLAAAVG